MPPALSDDESSNSSVEEETVPIRSRQTKSNTPAKPTPVVDVEESMEDTEEDNKDDGEESNENQEDDDDEVYVVEKIIKDELIDGEICYLVQWEGYPKKSDFTWETGANLASAQDVLDAYLATKKEKDPKSRSRKSLKANEESDNDTLDGKKKNGKEAAGKKRKGRKSIADLDQSTSTPAAKRAKPDWEPPPGSWEHDVDYVETVEESLDPKTGTPNRFGYVIWDNGRKTQHPLHHLYQKCPQKMLQYYEQHLVFHMTDHPLSDDINGA